MSKKKLSSIPTIYDFEDDEKALKYLEQQQEAARLQGLAIDTAFRSHDVSKFVERCEIEDYYKHPAISDFHLFCSTTDEQGNIVQNSLIKGKNDGYIDWALPGHDLSIPERHNCGFIRQKPDELTVTACRDNKDHYVKAKREHCWMMGCPNCFNDTCLRRGARVEKKLVCYGDLSGRRGFSKPKLKHWVISPPQTWAVKEVLTVKGYQALWKQVIELMKEYGMSAGIGVFHPYRMQKKDDYDPFRDDPVENYMWKVGPHFHIIGYGYVDTKSFRNDYGTPDHDDEVDISKWILKQIHPSEDIRSVRQTIAYLLTHAGIGRAEETFFVRSSRTPRGKLKKEVLEIQERMDSALDRHIDDLLDIDIRKCVPEDRVEEVQGIAGALNQLSFSFNKYYSKHTLEYSAESRYSHQAEFNAISDALHEMMIPERDYNLYSFEYDTGARYKFVTCMNEYMPSTGETPQSYVNHWSEHLDQVDWEGFAKRVYSRTFQVIRVFGELHPKYMKVIGTVRDKVSRVCPECGGEMGIYHGCLSDQCEPAEYNRDIQIFAKTAEADNILDVYKKFEAQLVAEGKTFLDFSLMIPGASSAVSAGLEDYDQAKVVDRRSKYPLALVTKRHLIEEGGK